MKSNIIKIAETDNVGALEALIKILRELNLM